MTPEELVTTAAPLAGKLGSAFYFVPATTARGAELGLDTLNFYMLGRGGVLGDVEAPVIASAFGYFSLDRVASMWEAATKVAEPRATARAFMGCSHEFGRTHFSSVAGLDAFCAAAEAVVAAAHPAGLALFAGLAAEPLPDDLPARAMHLAAVLREFRGSAHLVAVVASGVEPKVAHYIRRPEMFAIFGYAPEETPEPTEADRAALAEAEAMTDRIVGPAYGSLDETQAQALVEGLRAMQAALPS
jgi:hypothetical protein